MTAAPQTPAVEPLHTSVLFGGRLTIEYDDRILTPRPWTMAQSAWAAELHQHGPGGRMLELCAGAGHIGLLALDLEEAAGVLVDIDPTACSFAAMNAARAGLRDSVEIRCAPMTEAIHAGETFSVVVADPPWVSSAGITEFPEDPVLAIDGGPDGLELARTCLSVGDSCLHPEGAMVLQLGNQEQVEQVSRWLEDSALDLRIWEWRSYEPNGVLVGLRRRDAPRHRSDSTPSVG